MTNNQPTILYLTSQFTPPHTAAALRAENFTLALRHAGFSLLVATVAPDPAVKKISDNLTLCCVSPAGRLPPRLNRINLPRWPLCRPLPGPAPQSKSTKALFRLCSLLILDYHPDLIFATAPPFSLSAVAHRLAQTCRLPLVLEFRDAWFTQMPWPYAHFLQRRAARSWERRCVLDADRIITVTDTHRRILLDAYGPDLAPKITTVRHGFTPRTTLRSTLRSTSETPPAAEKTDRTPNDSDRTFTIAYTGQLRGIDIASLSPVQRAFQTLNHALRRLLLGARFCEQLHLEWMSPHFLLAALAAAAQQNPLFARSVRLVFVGEKFPQIDNWARRLNLTPNVSQLGPLPHDLTQNIARQADLLILSLYGIKNCPYHWCVPSKIYSYLATGKPILALVPPGEAADLVTQAAVGRLCLPHQVPDITQHLLQLFHQHQNQGIPLNPDWNFINRFQLPRQQKILIDTITSLFHSSEGAIL